MIAKEIISKYMKLNFFTMKIYLLFYEMKRKKIKDIIKRFLLRINLDIKKLILYIQKIQI